MLVNIKINGKNYVEDSSLTILKACKKNGIHIPTLCYLFHEESNFEHKPASCRVCVVEIEGKKTLVPACATLISEGMVINTNNKKVIEARKTIVELILSNHPNDCLYCAKNGKCELQSLAKELGIRQVRYGNNLSQENKEVEMRCLLKNASKCVLCTRCIDVCENIQGIGAISSTMRGFNTIISSPNKCVSCGQCVQVCPTGALMQVNDTDKVEEAINNPNKFVIVQTAPACRVSLGDEFNLPAGTDVTGKMVASLRAIGFDKVFDTNFGADLTIMEESNELINRLKEGKNLPLITSCCPGWVKFLEYNYPELINLPSSCKSPMEMTGAIIKSYYAEKNNIDPKNIVVVALMPCLAKKREAQREELKNNELFNTDYVLTVKEYADMLIRHGININDLEDEKYDSILGESTGAADIFANTGGVMEAAIRTASKLLTGEVKDVNFTSIRGLSGTRIAEVNINNQILKVCVVSGLNNARKVLDKVKNKEEDFAAIEIMACPGGCVNGGGQPIRIGEEQIDVIKARQQGIYNIDKNKIKRISLDNEEVKTLYNEYLEKPGSHKAHELLHTFYVNHSKI